MRPLRSNLYETDSHTATRISKKRKDRMGKRTEIKEDNTDKAPVGKKTIQKKKHDYSWVSEFRYGRSISVEFFKNNAWLLVIIVVSIIALIGLRYKTKTKMSEIKKLNTELARAESEKLQEKAAYMSLIRETEMRRMVQEKGLPLEFQEQPPYEIINE